jgi:protein ImuB
MGRRFLSVVCFDVGDDRLIQCVEWCDRYSPLAAADGNDGIILDITGCTHLFGGEGSLLLDLQRRLYRLDIRSKGAIGDTWGMAWALARYGKRFIVHGKDAISALDPLPVEALRLPDEIVLELRRLGLSTISAVRRISRSALDARFGATLLLRLDQIFNQAEEPVTPWRPPAPYRALRTLVEPVSTVSAVEYVLRGLLQEICTRLTKNQCGARHIDLACYRVDGTVDRCELRTSKPTRSISHLMRLFEERLDTLRCGFGFEAFVLSVLDSEALDPTQLSLWQSDFVEDDASLDALADRFGMKFGFGEVNRIRVRESFLPECAVEFYSVNVSTIDGAEWPAYRVRPIRIIDPPMRIEVSILIPGASPVQFFAGGQKHRIIRSEGPERLSPEWWREKGSRWGVRDYYRIEDDRGLRFWIFKHSSGQWFLHGHFA